MVEENQGKASDEESARANQELRSFWEKYVGNSPEKLALFVGVLEELQSAIVGETNILGWWQLVVKPVINGNGFSKESVDDAKEFLLQVMVGNDDNDARQRANAPNILLSELLAIYIARTRPLSQDDGNGAAQENPHIGNKVEDILLAFGRKRPRDFFHSLDDLVVPVSTRLQALTLLSSFLQHQAPHLYLVVNTPLVEHLLKCLMNDTSTTVLSVALTSLIMLLPHIPGSLGPHLPRMFLVYSRLLCWEKFSPLSTEADRSLVTDDRLLSKDNDDDYIQGSGDIGIDLNWEKAQPQEGVIEAATPELMTYFTYLYGLYPLNFMSYIRKPRRYLKNIDFPGTDAFDLDQAVIRSRTEQFRQVHLLHPNLYNMTVEEELVDPKWPKMDPADVVGECHGLCINSRQSITSSRPTPPGKLPETASMAPLNTASAKVRGTLSPTPSHVSLRSSSSWRDTQSTAVSSTTAGGGSPAFRPHDSSSDQPRPQRKMVGLASRSPPSREGFFQPAEIAALRSAQEYDTLQPHTNVGYLQREITLLRNELNFERWHKAQYSEHISQIMRRNVKEATQEAETLNLINANRALKKLDHVRKAREATIKDSALTRKQASSLEANMTERFNKFKQEQEVWQADADELQRLRSETKQYRDLLVATEARELNKSHKLELAQRDLEQLQKVQAQLQLAQRRLHEYEYREFEFDSTKRQRDILLKESAILKSGWQEQDKNGADFQTTHADGRSEQQVELRIPDPHTTGVKDLSSAGRSQLVAEEAQNIKLKRRYTANGKIASGKRYGVVK